MTTDDAMAMIDAQTDLRADLPRGTYANLRGVVADILARHARDVRTPPAAKALPPAADTAAPGWVALATEAARLKLRAGDVVAVRTDRDGVREYAVRHPAWQLGDAKTWVLGLAGIDGGYSLARVLAVKREERA